MTYYAIAAIIFWFAFLNEVREQPGWFGLLTVGAVFWPIPVFFIALHHVFCMVAPLKWLRWL